jgi:hypothetical protein
MSNDRGHAFLNGEFDLATIIEHHRAVPAQQPMEEVYNSFRQHEHAFVAVTENGGSSRPPEDSCAAVFRGAVNEG